VNTDRRKVKKRGIRQGIVAVAAGIALNLRQSQVALVPAVPVNGEVANT